SCTTSPPRTCSSCSSATRPATRSSCTRSGAAAARRATGRRQRGAEGRRRARVRPLMQFDLEGLAANDIYKLLTATVVPRPIAWVVTRSPEGRLNAAPFSFFNAFSAEPPLVAIGIGSRDGMPKDTARNINLTGQFVVNLVPEQAMQ